MGCHSVTNHFWVTVTLTSDLVFKNYCVQSISSILFDVGIPILGWWFLLGWRSGAYHFESLWPWHWLLASFLGFWCYITAIFPQMCLILDQFLWGHSSQVCDISCFFLELLHYNGPWSTLILIWIQTETDMTVILGEKILSYFFLNLSTAKSLQNYPACNQSC